MKAIALKMEAYCISRNLKYCCDIQVVPNIIRKGQVNLRIVLSIRFT